MLWTEAGPDGPPWERRRFERTSNLIYGTKHLWGTYVRGQSRAALSLCPDSGRVAVHVGRKDPGTKLRPSNVQR